VARFNNIPSVGAISGSPIIHLSHLAPTVIADAIDEMNYAFDLTSNNSLRLLKKEREYGQPEPDHRSSFFMTGKLTWLSEHISKLPQESPKRGVVTGLPAYLIPA